MYVLSNWTIVNVTTPSGAEVMRLFGEIFGHPRFQEGQEITVSALCSFRIVEDEFTVVTRSGSVYALAKPNPAEPDAMARVFSYLQQRGRSAPAAAAAVLAEASDGALDAATSRTRIL